MTPINVFALNASVVAWAIGAAVPLLVALVTRRYASGRVKAVTNLVASAITGSVIYLVSASGGYDWRGFINGFVNVLLPSLLTYYAAWKPLGVAGSDGALQKSSSVAFIGDDTAGE